MDAVADLFQRLLRKTADPANDDLKTYLRTLFIDFSEKEPELRSRVHVRADGSVSGFLGVLPMEMEFEGRRLKVANCGTFACDDRDSDPFAAPRLLRDVFSGPQDFSFTETSNTISTDMWRKARATVLAPYSLEWLRILKPAAFSLVDSSRAEAPTRAATPESGPPTVVDHPRDLGDAVVRHARLMRTPSSDEFQIQVRHPEAGQVSLRIVRTAESVHLTVQTSHEGLRREVQAQLPQLEQALREHGLTLGGFDVNSRGHEEAGRFLNQAPGGRTFSRPAPAPEEPVRTPDDAPRPAGTGLAVWA